MNTSLTIDGVVFILGLLLAGFTVKRSTTKQVHNAFAGIISYKDLRKLKPKTTGTMLKVTLLCALIFMAVVELTVHTPAPVPNWYSILRL